MSIFFVVSRKTRIDKGNFGDNKVSADNYNLIDVDGDKFVVVMGFASNENPPKARPESPRFRSFARAMSCAEKDHCEYGIQISTRAKMLLNKLQRKTELPRRRMPDNTINIIFKPIEARMLEATFASLLQGEFSSRSVSHDLYRRIHKKVVTALKGL